MASPPIPRVSRYTYRLHSRALVLEGLLAGVLATSDVVAKKSLGASQRQIVLLTMVPAALQVVSLLVSHRVATVERRRFFFAAGVAGRLALLLVAAVAGPWPFLGVLVAHGLVQSALVPAQNAVYQTNYDPEVRGRLFGRASIVGGLATVVSALGVGFALDADAEAYRWLYPVGGLAGFAACLVFGSIRLRRAPRAAEGVPPSGADAPPRHEAGRTPLGVLRETLLRDADFRRFETALFVYGLGFMCMQPVFARFFVEDLPMTYSDASLAKGVVFHTVNIAAIGIAGRLMDRIGVERLSMLACGVLFAFAGAMALVATPMLAIAAFALYGIGMAGVNIVWSMGPVHYAPPGGAARYMGVHLALVGVRAVIGQEVGGGVAEYFGSSRPTFVLAAAFFAAAALLMARARRLASPQPA